MVPPYAVVLSLMGAAVGMTLRVPEFQSRLSPGDPEYIDYDRLLVVLDVLEPSVIVWRALQRAAFFTRLPLNDTLDLVRQSKIAIGDAFGIVAHQLHDHEGIGNGQIGMMPGSFSEMTDRVYDH